MTPSGHPPPEDPPGKPPHRTARDRRGNLAAARAYPAWLALRAGGRLLRSHGHYFSFGPAIVLALQNTAGLKKGDELVIEIGTLRRHIGLPTSMAALNPTRAILSNKMLTVEMKEG